jgi:hypothetical protein
MIARDAGLYPVRADSDRGWIANVAGEFYLCPDLGTVLALFYAL